MKGHPHPTNNLRSSVKHVLGVLEWFYMLTEKILFQNRGLAFYYPPRHPPTVWQKTRLFPGVFFRHSSLTHNLGLNWISLKLSNPDMREEGQKRGIDPGSNWEAIYRLSWKRGGSSQRKSVIQSAKPSCHILTIALVEEGGEKLGRSI